jgi:hypothetical protein
LETLEIPERVLVEQSTSTHQQSLTHQHINTMSSTRQHSHIMNASTHQHINTSTHQHINTIINASTQCHQHINAIINASTDTSTHQHFNTSTHIPERSRQDTSFVETAVFLPLAPLAEWDNTTHRQSSELHLASKNHHKPFFATTHRRGFGGQTQTLKARLHPVLLFSIQSGQHLNRGQTRIPAKRSYLNFSKSDLNLDL